jgi:hypothetical protein
MSPEEQAEYDSYGITEGKWWSDEELADAARLYAEATGRGTTCAMTD